MATQKRRTVDEQKDKPGVQENPKPLPEKQGKHGRPTTENHKTNEFFEKMDSLNRE